MARHKSRPGRHGLDVVELHRARYGCPSLRARVHLIDRGRTEPTRMRRKRTGRTTLKTLPRSLAGLRRKRGGLNMAERDIAARRRQVATVRHRQPAARRASAYAENLRYGLIRRSGPSRWGARPCAGSMRPIRLGCKLAAMTKGQREVSCPICEIARQLRTGGKDLALLAGSVRRNE